MSNKRTSKVGSIIAFVISGVFFVSAGWLFLNAQKALDYVTVWSYEPSSVIQQINEDVEFTNAGTFIFYAATPSVEQKNTFNQVCPRKEVNSPIVGCYTGDDRIYIYDVTNAQLKGMEEVTAVHEMLHAVWYRTSDADRQKLTAELRAVYDTLDNEELTQRIEYYERAQPGEVDNELHSILGTEVATLSDSLETYYAQFFNRQAVLAFHDAYSGVYTELHTRADTLNKKMETLGASIQTRSDAYQAALFRYSSDVQSFNTRATNGSFQSQSQFSSERWALMLRMNALNVERDRINNDVVTYNEYLTEYMEISDHIQELNDSLDSFKQIDEAPSV